MAKGGFTGATPPRETSPEDYSGVWDITEQYGEQKAGSWPFQADDRAQKSLKFYATSQQYLSRTPLTAGDKRVFTFSCWVKRANIGGVYPRMFGTYNGGSYTGWDIEFNNNDQIDIHYYDGSSYVVRRTTEARYRDPSAWYSVVVAVNLNISGNDQVKLFVNGEQVTSFATTTNANVDTNIGDVENRIGNNYSYSDFYLAEVYFIDGQALSCDEFGFFDGQGIWQPKRFTGDYASGPIYSNAVPTADGFRPGRVPSHGFDGDLTSYIAVDNTTFNLDVGSWGLSGVLEVYTGSNHKYTVDGGTESSMTANGWTNVGNANSITTLTLTRDDGNYPYFNAIRLDGVILTDAVVGRNSFHLDFSKGATDQSGLGNDWTANNITVTSGSVPSYSTTGFTTTTYPITNLFDNDLSTFARGPGTITFSPPITGSKFRIYMAGNTTSNFNINGTAPSATFSTTAGWVDFSSDINGTLTSIETYYAVPYFAVYQFIYAIEVDGVILSAAPSDYCVDSPINGSEASTGAGHERRGNYCTLNPVQASSGVMSIKDGNLVASQNSSAVDYPAAGTIFVNSGKWYWEVEINNTYCYAGIVTPEAARTRVNYLGEVDGGAIFHTAIPSSSIIDGTIYDYSSTASAASNGDTIGVSLNFDDNEVIFYINGVSQGVFGDNFLKGRSWTAGVKSNGTALLESTFNFGQRSFKYPLSGFSPLATSFLPEPSELVKNPSKAFDILLWSGAGSASDRTITGLDMESGPDMVWSKTRNHGYHNNIFDAVRGFSGGGPALTTDHVSSQANAGQIKSTDSTSITWEKDSSNGYVWYNESGKNYVSWAWDAGTATTSVAVGASNSQAFDQSQRWRDNIASSNGWNVSYPVTNIFNGAYNGGGGAANNGGGGTITFTPPAAITVTKLELSVYSDITLGLPDGTTQTIAGVGNADKYVEADIGSGFSFTGSNSITISRTAGFIYLGRIRINGKELVDDDITINTPEAACDVRANPEAGFSIVKVDSPNSTEARVHGLSKAPDFIIAKAIASGNTQHYHIFHSHFGRSHYATFQRNAFASSDQWGSQEPNPTSFYVKTNTGSGANYSGGMIYYIWHAVENYSAFGSYEGTDNTDGRYIHLGFKPKWLMIKNATSSGDEWMIYDTERRTFNANSVSLDADNAGSEDASGFEIDFLTQGFKLRSSNVRINGPQTYIYAAFAGEYPFPLNSRAR